MSGLQWWEGDWLQGREGEGLQGREEEGLQEREGRKDVRVIFIYLSEQMTEYVW